MCSSTVLLFHSKEVLLDLSVWSMHVLHVSVCYSWDCYVCHHCCPLMFIHHHHVTLINHHQFVSLDLAVPQDLDPLVLNHLWRRLLSWPCPVLCGMVEASMDLLFRACSCAAMISASVLSSSPGFSSHWCAFPLSATSSVCQGNMRCRSASSMMTHVQLPEAFT